MQIKCIYWNTKNIQLIDRIIDILKFETPQLFFLSEINSQLIENSQIKLDSLGYEYFPNPGCDRIKILKQKSLKASLNLQDSFYSVIKINDFNTYVISIHLPSQYFRHMDCLKDFIRNFRLIIDSEIGSSLIEKILIIGDFNVNPFEKPMIDFDGFLATNSINSRSHVTHSSKTKATYYNPTWQLYSRKHFPGTILFKRPSGSSYDILEFHFLDQVVISNKLLKSITEEHISVIEETMNFSFLSKTNKKISGSDHLPLSYQFNLE